VRQQRPAAPKTSKSPPVTASASGSAIAQVTADWQAFFDAKTPVARRVELLQNGQVFAAVIKAQAGSALASSASAKVTKVTLVSPAQAKVTYSILVGGTPELKNQTGAAILQDGRWKVGDASFCGCSRWRTVARHPGCPRPAVARASGWQAPPGPG